MNGVYCDSLLPLYQHTLSRRGVRFATFHSQDGYDEITLSAPIRCVSETGERELSARDFDVAEVAPADITGGITADQSARIIRNILTGQGTEAQEAIVCANAALAMFTHEGKGTLPEYVNRGREAIRSGKALETLQRSIELA